METDIVTRIRAITSADEMSQVRQEIEASHTPLTAEVQKALLDKLEEFTARSRAAREGAISLLSEHGVSYPLTDWLTPKNYAKRFDLKSGEVVLNWINRGIIPADHIKEIPELGLRLVKAVEYSPRTYKERVVKDAS